jgi:hypothetical protein
LAVDAVRPVTVRLGVVVVTVDVCPVAMMVTADAAEPPTRARKYAVPLDTVVVAPIRAVVLPGVLVGLESTGAVGCVHVLVTTLDVPVVAST